ncbi:MAG: exodeoxyribonuclease VII large subunit [Spirochaetales bacterium]|nr:exodeoxyribonuclease VII large subunit [Spirochaetales bacterium]
MIIEQKPFSVSQLTRMVKGLLEREFTGLMVEGEISNFRPSSTGHYYFSLKDKDAVISAVMFKNRLSTLKFMPSDGNFVRIRGSISVYPPRGSYQMICESMEKAGEGEILAMLEERKRRLAAEGFFDGARKRRLPFFPEKIGIVTSPTGAAVKDIMRVTRRRNPGMDIVILPAAVQGVEAGELIAAQIKRAALFDDLDLLIVGRGGGSLEDLLPFSEEVVVRAIVNCPIPVISAVGHEIDTSLADYAADAAAPTPSAAAELVCPPREEILDKVTGCRESMRREVKGRMERIRLLLDQFKPEEMKRLMEPLIRNKLLRFDDARETMERSMANLISIKKHRIELLQSTLEAGSPTTVLHRGYALLKDSETGKLITRPDQAQIGGKIEIEMADGDISAIVEEIKNEKL